MSGVGSSGVGRIYIKAGSAEIDLSGSAREVNDAWLNKTLGSQLSPEYEWLGRKPSKARVKSR